MASDVNAQLPIPRYVATSLMATHSPVMNDFSIRCCAYLFFFSSRFMHLRNLVFFQIVMDYIFCCENATYSKLLCWMGNCNPVLRKIAHVMVVRTAGLLAHRIWKILAFEAMKQAESNRGLSTGVRRSDLASYLIERMVSISSGSSGSNPEAGKRCTRSRHSGHISKAFLNSGKDSSTSPAAASVAACQKIIS